MEKIVKFVILACLLACSEPKIEHKKCHEMNTSHALPIEFWDIDEDTYNEKEVCGITPVCFCQPRLADKSITITLPNEQTSETYNDYLLLIKNSANELIESLPFDRVSDVDTNIFLNTDFNTDFDNWFNTSNNVTPSTGGSTSNWVHSTDFGGSIKNTTVNSFGTKNLRLSALSLPSQPSKIRIKYAVVGSDLTSIQVVIRDASNTQLYNHAETGVINDGEQHYFEFYVTLSSIWLNADHILIVTPSSPNVAGNVYYITDVTFFTGTTGDDPYTNYSSKYSVSFTPEDFGITNEQIRLYIANNDSPNTLIKKSDCISVKQTHPCTINIDYTNSTDFDGIPDTSPNISYNLLIPGIFFEESNTKESEDIELSNDEIVRLYDKIEEKRELQIGFMPHYMHRKTILALAFDFVRIDGKEWISRDEYKKIEGNRHYPLRRASILLTDKNFIKENQL